MNMKKGFTLIEIMIVVAIIAILAAIAIPNFISYRKTSQMNSCLANQEQIRTACEAFYIKNNSYTTTLSDLADQTKGQFLKEVPVCPNGGTYSITQDDKLGVVVSCTGGDEGYKHVKGGK